MLIGVVSDTHNNLKNINQIISLFNDEEVALVVHTGDITNSNSLEQFSKLNCQLTGVYGNNDRHEIGLKEAALKNSFTFQNPPKYLQISGKKIMIFHEPDTIDAILLEKNDIDIILHGHTHRFRHEVVNGTLIFNPGESAGMLNGKNAIGIINLESLEIKRIFF